MEKLFCFLIQKFTSSTGWIIAHKSFSLFFLALLLGLGVVAINDFPPPDVAARYAPMAEAFAVGEWHYAFHPRIPLLHPTLAGCFCFLFGISGFVGCQLAAVLAFSLCVFPLYKVFNLVWSDRVAWLGTFFYIICADLLQIAGEGLRDNFKTLSVSLAVLAWILIYRKEQRLSYYGLLALGTAIGISARADLALVFVPIWVIIGIEEIRSRAFPWRIMAAALLVLALISPLLIFNWQYTGYPVPDSRYAAYWQNLERKFYPAKQPARIIKTAPSAPSAAKVKTPAKIPPKLPQVLSSSQVKLKDASFSDFIHYFLTLLRGFYPWFGVPALLVVIWRIRRREFALPEQLILTFLIIHAFLVAAQILISDQHLYISTRYLTPAAPLAFGWTALGALRVWGKGKQLIPRWFNRATAVVLLSILALGFTAAAAGPVIKHYTSQKKSALYQGNWALANWIAKDYIGPHYFKPEIDWFEYRSFKRPRVILPRELAQAGYLSGGSSCSSFLAGADYLVWEKGKFMPNDDHWVLVREFCCYKRDYMIWKKTCGSLPSK